MREPRGPWPGWASMGTGDNSPAFRMWGEAFSISASASGDLGY